MAIQGLFCARFCGALTTATLLLSATSSRAGMLAYQPVILYSLSPSPQRIDQVVPTPSGVAVVGESAGATLWTSSGATILQPPEPPVGPFLRSEAYAASGSQQVGYIDYTYDNQTHAMLWNGSSQSMVDLHPTQFTQFDCSQAMGIGGGQQVGFLYNYSSQSLPTVSHAVLWNGTAASAVDLNPAGFVRSWANAADGIHQVGMASTSLQLGRIDPILWTGTAASAVDLAPTLLPQIGAAQVFGVGGNQQVGTANYFGSSLPADHALLWTGTAASAVDLAPSSFSDSEALATNGIIQVGYGIDWAHNLDNAKPHALAWSSSAESVVDLQALLPADFTESKALSVDAAGNVYGYALGPALPGSLASGYYAVEWEAVPEPGGLALLMMCMPAIVRRQRPPLPR